MVKVFIETSVWIRYLTADDEEKFGDCVDLLKRIDNGKIIPYISAIVLLEIYFVLFSVYKFNKKVIIKAIEKLLLTKNLVLIEKTSTKKSLKLLAKYGVKFSDVMIAGQIPDGVSLCTYDTEFKKIDKLRLVEPKDLIK